MIFERKKYLDELIAGRGNGLVKIITGVRRCGKSFLLFDIWHNWLLEHGVTESHIVEIQLDDFRNRRLRKPDALLDYIDSKVVDDIHRKEDELGVLTIGLLDFLTDKKLLEQG